MSKVQANSNSSRQAKAVLRNLRTSVQKANLVLRAIRDMPIEKALSFLSVCPKRVANDVRGLVLSAAANAENNEGLNVDDLVVKEAYAGKAFGLKRFRPRAKGRASRIIKHGSHLTVVLGENVESGLKG